MGLTTLILIIIFIGGCSYPLIKEFKTTNELKKEDLSKLSNFLCLKQDKEYVSYSGDIKDSSYVLVCKDKNHVIRGNTFITTVGSGKNG